MTPKEKAKELVEGMLDELNKFSGGQEMHALSCAKKCALLAVNEVCKTLFDAGCRESHSETLQFYLKVKTEIENL